MLFDWTPAKHEWTLAERGFGFDSASRIFESDDVIEVVDGRRDYGEVRVQAIGEVDGLVLFVVYTDRGETRWIISARKADRKERKRWRER